MQVSTTSTTQATHSNQSAFGSIGDDIETHGMLSLQEARQLSKLSAYSLRAEMKAGRLRHTVIGRKVLIFRSSLMQLLINGVRG